MKSRAVARFEVCGWDESAYHHPDGEPCLSRATVRKTFDGDLLGESTAEVLMCQAEPGDHTGGAGYVANERVIGSLAGRDGSFVVQHGGLSGGTGPRRTFGNVVPNSGTGQLAGLSGTVEITVDEDGTHRFIIEYELPDDDPDCAT